MIENCRVPSEKKAVPSITRVKPQALTALYGCGMMSPAFLPGNYFSVSSYIILNVE